MADLSDVENQMVSIIAGSLGLGTNYLPGSVASSSAAMTACRVYRGSPLAASLATDIAAGIANITVFPVAGASRRTTKYFPQWTLQTAIIPTTMVTVTGNRITFYAPVPETNVVIGIQFGPALFSQAFAYRPSATDTATSICAAFASMIPSSTATGPILSLPTSNTVQAIVAPDQSMWLETRRQEQNVWVIGWCPSPAIRDVTMAVVDEGFANLLDPSGNLTDQFALPDGSYARLLYTSNHTDDQAQRSGIWRRDLRYTVSYPTTMVQAFPTLVSGISNLTAGTEVSISEDVDSTNDQVVSVTVAGQTIAPEYATLSALLAEAAARAAGDAANAVTIAAASGVVVVSGTGSSQATATLLAAAQNVATSGVAGGGFILPTTILSGTISLTNDWTGDLLLYPPLGAQIDSYGVNVPVLIAPGATASFSTNSALTQWYRT